MAAAVAIPQTTAGKNTFAGLFLVTLATLMYEILLTRIFSVTMWYHFAFMAVSLALFGMTVGAILVYLGPHRFRPEQAKLQLSVASLLFSVSAVGSFLIHVRTQPVPTVSLVGIASVALAYVVLAVPFAFSGVCVTVALTRFPRQVSQLYAADLAGAAVGCLALIYALRVADGPTAVVFVAILAAMAAALFAGEAGAQRLALVACGCLVLMGAFTAVSLSDVARGHPLVRLGWAKGVREGSPLYEKWNSFSRITIYGDPQREVRPTGVGMSSAMPAGLTVRKLLLTIDSNAATALTGFDGDPRELSYLRYSVTNLAHYIRPHAKVLVIGSGGGKDVLSALAFRQLSVMGIEMNRDILDAVNVRFGEFTGHLDRDPRVTFVNDEARSYIARRTDRFDIIQVSLIDTWAATAAGAFVLAEQSLYTVEAWRTFVDHLSRRGVLTFSRWYFRGYPGEMYRLTSLASAALRESGIKSPRDHILIVRCMAPARRAAGQGEERVATVESAQGLGTMLVSREPFSRADVTAIERVASDLQFEVVLTPRYALDPVFAALASGDDFDRHVRSTPLDLDAPTDNTPFFFHMLRLRDILKRRLWELGMGTFNMKAVVVLGALLVTVTMLTLLCIVVPLLLMRKAGDLRGAAPLLIFFGSIGVGFMLIEISQMQRLIIFLGHPTCGLSVVLFSLLLSSSLGSYLTGIQTPRGLSASGGGRLLLLLAVLAAFGMVTPFAIQTFRPATTAVRVLVAVGILSAIGIFMGMAFPTGMKVAASRSASLTPWLWGINGATSVCASVLAIAIALTWGISAAFWTGCSAYVVALLSFVWGTRGT
jgi:hypothetical protein